jgi:hypothetical protein
MGEDRHLIRRPPVTVEAAAVLTKVEVGTIYEWARRGVIHIEARGHTSMVQLAEVEKAAASRARPSRRGTLRDRLKDAEDGDRSADVVNIADLQELARNRDAR